MSRLPIPAPLFLIPLVLAALAAAPALAQQPAPPPPAAAPQGQPVKDVPLGRLMTDGAQVRGADSKDRIILQLGKFVFVCRHGDGKPATCDLVI